MIVPVVAMVDGVKIEFYPDEHPPPHFHARYAEFVAQIETGPARFCADRCLPQNSGVCYRGLLNIRRD
jgi:hypothetical protein